MKITAPLLACLFLAMPQVRANAQRKVAVRHAVEPAVSVRLFGSFAELRIIGWDRDTVAVTGSVPADARFESSFGPNMAAARGAKMYLESASGTAGGKLELRVPAGARVWAKSGSADIEVTGIVGGLDLNIVGGRVKVSGNPRELNVESMDGNIVIDGTPAWLRAKTATGDIDLAGGSGDAVLTSISGTIRVGGGVFERAKIESVTGAVVFAGDLARGASLDINTHSGGIELRLARRSGAELDVATVTGTIENSLTGRAALPGREGRGQEIGLSLGEGGARVYVRSFKGSIQLRQR
jgi:hypothetical protein